MISSPVVAYCDNAILVAPDVAIVTNIAISGMNISFDEGFIAGEDTLIYPDAGGKIQSVWHSSGYLELKPKLTMSPSQADYEKAIESVVYKNKKSVPTLSPRKISISLIDANYYEGHYYQYIPFNGITWYNAKIAANKLKYFGLQGYLATITSEGENKFIGNKTLGTGWIGASDEASEGYWRWVTGPEGEENSNEGRLFWIGTGIEAATGQKPYGAVADAAGILAYQNWGKYYYPVTTLEPNNAGGENYAHILVGSGSSSGERFWNDLSNTGDTNSGSDYYPRGFLVEYGGMKSDPQVELSATIDLIFNTISFNTTPIAPICEGAGVELNQPDNSPDPAKYSWDPDKTLSELLIANPVATPVSKNTYHVKGTRGTCTMSHDFVVSLNPKPEVSINVNEQTCYGYSLDAAYNVTPAPDISNFLWIFGKDTIANGPGYSKVTIPLGNSYPTPDLTLYVEDRKKCSNHVTQNIQVQPKLGTLNVNVAEQCLYKTFEFSVTPLDPDPSVTYDWNFGDGTTGTSPKVTHQYKNSGKYDIKLTAKNGANCSNSVVNEEMVYALPVPVASFTVSDSIVTKDRPKVDFTNTSTGAISQVWNFGDYSTSQEISPSHSYKTTGRDTVLLVIDNEYLCSDSVTHNVLVAFGQIFPPTAFSPNAPNEVDRIFKLDTEGVNDEGYHFWVMSRWDDLIFTVQHKIEGWDGKMENGSFAPPGVYVWRLIFIDFLGDLHRQSGTVTLIY